MKGDTIMAQTTNDNMTTSSLQETQKQQKKQAKRESKLRLDVEQARGDVQKAEQKIANARVDFEVASARLRTLEEELARLQGTSKSK
jgi:outer membrane protein TolC